ncbi:MAG TPA: alpha/beta hydrolase [Ktedonobacteraceae bacterium]
MKIESITRTGLYIDDVTFHADVEYIESLWQRRGVPLWSPSRLGRSPSGSGNIDLPLIDIGGGEPLVFVPILEHLEFVYARQIRAFSSTRRVIMYRRQESRTRTVGLVERAEELKRVLDSLGLEQADFVGHGDGAMVLFEFAIRYPRKCRSLIIIAQGADYRIAPHPFIWLLHELFLRLPVEHFLPASFLRRIVINYIVSNDPAGAKKLKRASLLASSPYYLSPGQGEAGGRSLVTPAADTKSTGMLPRKLIEEQFRKIALWPFVYKFSVLPIIHNFDIQKRLASLTMPILLINRANDALSPEPKTRWLAQNLPDCAGYHVISGEERFFMYAEAETVNQLFRQFLASGNESV